jgi:hypothetical protein
MKNTELNPMEKLHIQMVLERNIKMIWKWRNTEYIRDRIKKEITIVRKLRK